MKERSDEELNRIIAEWCGWKVRLAYKSAAFALIKPDGIGVGIGRSEEEAWLDCPAYSTDLNALHELWKTSKDFVKAKWLMEISSQVIQNPQDGFCLTFASARQRAEALVAVIEGEKK